MSDRELVAFDPQQFDRFMQRFGGVHAELQIIRERLGPPDKDKSIQRSLEVIAEALGAGGTGNVESKLDQLFAKLATIEHQQILLLELIEGETGPITNLQRKVDLMSTNIDRIEKEAADLAEDVTIVKTALGDLKALVADLKAQVAQGQIDQARLDAAAASLEKVDDDLDALTAPETPPPAPEG